MRGKYNHLLAAALLGFIGMDKTQEFFGFDYKPQPPPAPPKPTDEDLRKIAAAQEKRERKLRAKLERFQKIPNDLDNPA